MQTRLTELLHITQPVMLAGMGGVAYAELAAAVTNAGGIGTLGAAPLGDEALVAEMRTVRSLTSGPFGVDLLTALPGDLTKKVELMIEAGATLFVAALGVPSDVIELCHNNGVLVANMCGRVIHARRAVDAGCDLVIAQGTEAGGHTGQVATFPLVPQVVDAVGEHVPVVAAGGIVDGRGLAAALALGADGVWVGTRFIATPEARVVDGYHDALVRTGEDGTVISKAYSGKPMRVVANDYTRYFEQHPEELAPFPQQFGRSFGDNVLHLSTGPDGTTLDTTRECYPAGQGTGSIHEVLPAATVVTNMVSQAAAILERLGSAVAATQHDSTTSR